MTRRILIDDNPNVTRMVVVHDNNLEQIEIEIKNRKSLVGNIYLARVNNRDRTLQAAFVDYGQKRNGMLSKGHVYLGDDDTSTQTTSPDQQEKSIQELLQEEQMVLVQIIKDEHGEKKGADVTMYTSLKGRYYTIYPYKKKDNTSLRRWTSLTDIGRKVSESEREKELQLLLKKWEVALQEKGGKDVPCLVYEECNLIERALRDYYTEDIQEVLIEGEEGYDIARKFMCHFSDVKNVKLHTEGKPLFHLVQNEQDTTVEQQIQDLLKPKVSLRSGGSIVINRTEALTAIDVNSGRGNNNFTANMEAAEEIARHIRLRNLEGLIVIDFINMDQERWYSDIEQRFMSAMRSDFGVREVQKYRIGSFDKMLGLLPLSRQRLRGGIYDYYFESRSCGYCSGTGNPRTFDSIFFDIYREVQQEVYNERRELLITLPMQHIVDFMNYRRQGLTDIEEHLGVKISVQVDDTLLPDRQFNITPVQDSSKTFLPKRSTPCVQKKEKEVKTFSQEEVFFTQTCIQEQRVSSEETHLLSQERGVSSQERRVPSQERRVPSQERRVFSQEREVSSQETKTFSQEEVFFTQTCIQEQRVSSQETRTFSQEEVFFTQTCIQEQRVSSQEAKTFFQEELPFTQTCSQGQRVFF